MSIFIPVVEQPRHARGKPDLRLAESYVPALVLYLKCMGYTCIAPIILLMQWKVTVISVTAFALLLYVDHLYLSHGMGFIDTTAICLDVFGSTLLMLAISLLRPCSQQCQAVLALWTILGFAYLLVSPNVPRPIVHVCAFTLALLFIYADTGALTPILMLPQMNQTLLPVPSPPGHVAFLSRTLLYVTLALVDIYLFRPLFQQENERLLFCKYAPVLLGSWPWYVIFGLFLGTAQLTKHWRLLDSRPGAAPSSLSVSAAHHNHHHHAQESAVASSSSSLFAPISSSSSTSIQDLDIMEAFRLAKEQHMGGKGAN